MSKPRSGLYSGTIGVAVDNKATVEVGVHENSTAAVWQHIEATQACYPGTELPRSFVMDVPGGKIWTHGNATKHMWEAIVSIKNLPAIKGSNPSLYTQFILYDYRETLVEASKMKIKQNELVRIGNWELMFSKSARDKYPVVKHAVFLGLR